MNDPFSDLPKRKKGRSLRNFPGTSVPEFRAPKRPVLVQMRTSLEAELDSWLSDQADAFGVSKSHYVRDILEQQRKLTIIAMRERGMTPHVADTLTIPDRSPGYRAALYPSGDEVSHLDNVPLGIEELL